MRIGGCDLIVKFRKYYKRAVETLDHMRQETVQSDQHWLQSPDCLT